MTGVKANLESLLEEAGQCKRLPASPNRPLVRAIEGRAVWGVSGLRLAVGVIQKMGLVGQRMVGCLEDRDIGNCCRRPEVGAWHLGVSRFAPPDSDCKVVRRSCSNFLASREGGSGYALTRGLGTGNAITDPRG